MWMIDDLHTNIVASLEANTKGLDPAERVRFAHRFSIPGWIPQAISALVSRKKPLSTIEMECLGYAGAAEVSQLREERLREDEERLAVEAWWFSREGGHSYLISIRLPLIAFFRASCRGGAPRSRGGNPRCCAQAARKGASRCRGGCPPADRKREKSCRSSCCRAQNASPGGGGHAHHRISIGRGAQCVAAFPHARSRRACTISAPYDRGRRCPPSDLA
jgi:hypothetical protein